MTIQLGSRLAQSATPKEPLSLLEAAIAGLGITLLLIVLFRAPKGIFRLLPYSGLMILLVLYSLFGWALKIYSLAWWAWVGVIGMAAAIALLPSVELGMLGLRSMILAGFAALAMFYPPLFLIAKWVSLGLATLTAWTWAIGSARYRMNSVGIERSHAIWIIAIVSWAGLWIGWLVESAIAPQLGDWIRQNIVL